MNQPTLPMITMTPTIERSRDVVLPPLLVTVKQACAILGVSRTTLYHFVKRGIVKEIRFGGALRFRYSELCDLVDALATDGDLVKTLAAPTAGGRPRPRTSKARSTDRRSGASP